MLQHDRFGYNQIKNTKTKVLLYREILSCTEPPSVQDNIPYTLMPFQFSRYQHRFFSTWPILQSAWQPSKRTRPFANARRFVRFLHSIRNRFSAPQGGASQLAQACVTTVGEGEVSESLMPRPVQACWVLPSFFALIFLSVMDAFFLSFWILHRCLCLIPYLFLKTNNASFQRLRYFSDLGPKIKDIHIYNCCSTR